MLHDANDATNALRSSEARTGPPYAQAPCTARIASWLANLASMAMIAAQR